MRELEPFKDLRWKISGEYMESCNCDLACPCAYQPNPVPSRGFCAAALMWHIVEGNYGSVGLQELDVALVLRTPKGPFRAGGWIAALYMDERASGAQREGLQAIFTGRAGGRLGRLAELIGTLVGVSSVPFERRVTGKTMVFRIRDTLHVSIETVPDSRGGEEIITIQSPYHSTADAVVLAKAAISWYRDHGLSWDNSGKNGYVSTFSLEGP